jgi:two-component system, NtrC family, nitrogen regulation sensor histidine kinase NtrY
VILIFIGEEQYHVSVQVKEIMLLEKRVRIVLIQNLNNELEAKEIEAWGQLMRVLTHEIMNSVTPIFSLTGAIQGILSNPDGTRKDLSTLTEENTEDIYSSLATIASRSKGLLKFINAYKEYSKPIGLHLEEADVTALVNRVVDLLNPDLEKFGIRLRKSYTTRQILAKTDIALMENVLINLIKNGIEAVPHDGTGVINIELKTKANGRVSILVSDNGSGIEPETLPKIFIPFFTTKSNGSGIGLSLSRQIMKLHNGSIRANSSPDTGASFIIEWR